MTQPARLVRDWMTAPVRVWPAIGPGVGGVMHGMRGPVEGDAEALAVLMLESYRGTIDDSGGETIEFAREEVRKLLGGEYGRFEPACSVVVERDGAMGREVVSATLVTWMTGVTGVTGSSRVREGPFVAFSMTSPAWKRRGLARAGLRAVFNRLAERGEKDVSLVVTRGNPAQALYVEMGFEVVGSREGKG